MPVLSHLRVRAAKWEALAAKSTSLARGGVVPPARRIISPDMSHPKRKAKTAAWRAQGLPLPPDLMLLIPRAWRAVKTAQGTEPPPDPASSLPASDRLARRQRLVAERIERLARERCHARGVVGGRARPEDFELP